jgi:hypothetical protein
VLVHFQGQLTGFKYNDSRWAHKFMEENVGLSGPIAQEFFKPLFIVPVDQENLPYEIYSQLGSAREGVIYYDHGMIMEFYFLGYQIEQKFKDAGYDTESTNQNVGLVQVEWDGYIEKYPHVEKYKMSDDDRTITNFVIYPGKKFPFH